MFHYSVMCESSWCSHNPIFDQEKPNAFTLNKLGNLVIIYYYAVPKISLHTVHKYVYEYQLCCAFLRRIDIKHLNRRLFCKLVSENKKIYWDSLFVFQTLTKKTSAQIFFCKMQIVFVENINLLLQKKWHHQLQHQRHGNHILLSNQWNHGNNSQKWHNNQQDHGNNSLIWQNNLWNHGNNNRRWLKLVKDQSSSFQDLRRFLKVIFSTDYHRRGKFQPLHQHWYVTSVYFLF